MEVDGVQVNDQTEVTPGVENDQSTPQSYDLAGWTAGATPEQKDKYAAELSKHAKMTSFIDMAMEAQDRLSRAIVRPGEGASEEEVAAYREAIGMPADSNSYELNAEGSGTETFLDDLRAMAFEREMSQEDAQAMVDLFVKTEQKAKESLETERANFIEKGVKELQNELGSNFQPKMLKANQMVEVHFGKEFANFLGESQLGNDPRFIRGMIALSDLVAEDTLDTPPGGKEESTGYNFPNTPDM